jgi:hypothetical protein
MAAGVEVTTVGLVVLLADPDVEPLVTVLAFVPFVALELFFVDDAAEQPVPSSARLVSSTMTHLTWLFLGILDSFTSVVVGQLSPQLFNLPLKAA